MSTLAEVPPVKHKREMLDQAVIRFAGDSGDGMQITGNQFTNTAALYGNDIATFPDYPAEIRAPAGTIPGVSGFQLHFSSNEVYTPGDAIDVLIAMNPAAVEANKLALKGGYSYCEATEAFQVSYEIPPAQLTPGLYRSMSGNQALALGFVTAAQKAGLTLFQGSYPITPASDILHELSQYKDFGVMTFQAEDEIAAITSSIGAAYAGALAITTTSRPC